jgi:hypothetical protein
MDRLVQAAGLVLALLAWQHCAAAATAHVASATAAVGASGDVDVASAAAASQALSSMMRAAIDGPDAVLSQAFRGMEGSRNFRQLASKLSTPGKCYLTVLLL